MTANDANPPRKKKKKLLKVLFNSKETDDRYCDLQHALDIMISHNSICY